MRWLECIMNSIQRKLDISAMGQATSQDVPRQVAKTGLKIAKFYSQASARKAGKFDCLSVCVTCALADL